MNGTQAHRQAGADLIRKLGANSELSPKQVPKRFIRLSPDEHCGERH